MTDHTHSHDDPLIPPVAALPPADHMFRVNWVAQLVRSPSGTPYLPTELAVGLGRGVRIVDVREADQLTGELGHIPGCDWIPRDRIASLSERLDRDAPVVLVSRRGNRAGELAKQLEQQGMRMVAALEGGMVAWKRMGFGVSRDPAVLERRDRLRTIAPPTTEAAELTVERVREHVGDASAVRFIKLAALMLHGRMSCVDGRDENGIIGTLGGDAGEFLLLLAAIERTTGKQLTLAETRTLLARRLDALGRFYIHTDTHSANAAIKAMRADPRLEKALADVNGTLAWRRFLAAPPAELHEILLEHMAQPKHIGCGHVRLMWTNPDRYGVREELTQNFLRAFLLARWQGATDAELVPLPGGHAERAVLQVFVEGDLHSFTPIPLVSPSCQGAQVFVCHPQVVGYLRRQLVELALDQRDIVPDVSAEVLSAEIERLAGAGAGASLGVLAKGLPIFDATFTPDGWRVVHSGAVPM